MDETKVLKRRRARRSTRRSPSISPSCTEPFIHKLPLETLCHIFLLLLQDSYSEADLPMTDGASVDGFFKTTAPYNISRVCRSWRDVVITSGAFWSEFALRFNDPSSRVIKKAKMVIALHLERSKSFPLSCAISLTGKFDEHATREIVDDLVKHLNRWRKMQLRFDFQESPCASKDICSRRTRKSACSESLFCPRVRSSSVGDLMDNARIHSNDLLHVEELNISPLSLFDLEQHRGSSLAEDDGDAPMLSLIRLGLEMPERYDKLARWLELTPNIKELKLAFYPLDPRWQQKEQDTFHIPPMRLENLRIVIVDRCASQGWGYHGLTSDEKASAFVVRYLTCPSLIKLSVRLTGDDTIHHLHDFFHRSSPSLKSLDLHIMNQPLEDEGWHVVLLDRIIASLLLLPTITSLRLASRSRVERLLEELQSTTFLPSLEEIVFHFTPARPSQFVDFVKSRCSSQENKLKKLTLLECSARQYGAWFGGFRLDDDLSRIPAEWAGMKPFIEKGLQFEHRRPLR